MPSLQPSGHLQRGRGHTVTLGPGPEAVPLLHGRAVSTEHPPPVVGFGRARRVLADDNPSDEVVAALHVVAEHWRAKGMGVGRGGRRGEGGEQKRRQEQDRGHYSTHSSTADTGSLLLGHCVFLSMVKIPWFPQLVPPQAPCSSGTGFPAASHHARRVLPSSLSLH